MHKKTSKGKKVACSFICVFVPFILFVLFVLFVLFMLFVLTKSFCKKKIIKSLKLPWWPHLHYYSIFTISVLLNQKLKLVSWVLIKVLRFFHKLNVFCVFQLEVQKRFLVTSDFGPLFLPLENTFIRKCCLHDSNLSK